MSVKIMKKISRNNRGFTLVELVVAIAVLGVVTAVTVPSFNAFLPIYRVKSAGRDLYSNFQKIRMAAVKENQTIVFAFNPRPANNYTIFVDNGDGGGIANNFTLDGSERLLGNYRMPESIDIVSANFSGAQEAGFNGRGESTGGRTGNIVIQNKHSRTVTLNLSVTGSAKLL